MQSPLSLLDLDGYVVSVRCLKPIHVSFGGCELGPPRTAEEKSLVKKGEGE
tara:strand:- start:1926 stop:2078 length:153 start_codon:yes stop_codon:yes gene_type:complete